MKAGESRRTYRLTDYTSVFKAAEELNARAILVGGQAVYFWAMGYLDRYPELSAFMPYTSQDADYLADVPAAQELARRIKSQFNPAPRKGGMLGLSLGDIPLDGDMRVEILGRVNGLLEDSVRAAAVAITWQGMQIHIIHPVQLFIGKGHNLLDLEQSDRQDAKHFGIMQWVMRGLLNDLAHDGEKHPRTFLDCTEALMKFALSDEGIKLIDLGFMPQAGL